jgi:two-component system, sensor histidine kinase and response regulator
VPAGGLSPSLQSALEDCRLANARAIRIITDMADAVRLAAGEHRIHPTDIDVQALLAGVVRRIAPDAAARGVRMVWSADAHVVRADEDLLRRALERLLETALRHAHAEGTIAITLRDGTIVMRLRSAADEVDVTPPESALRGLAMHFADASMRAQGGAAWAECDEGALLFCIALPRSTP